MDSIPKKRMTSPGACGVRFKVAFIGRADRQFWLRPSEQPDSEKLIRILGRARVRQNTVVI